MQHKIIFLIKLSLIYAALLFKTFIYSGIVVEVLSYNQNGEIINFSNSSFYNVFNHCRQCDGKESIEYFLRFLYFEYFCKSRFLIENDADFSPQIKAFYAPPKEIIRGVSCRKLITLITTAIGKKYDDFAFYLVNDSIMLRSAKTGGWLSMQKTCDGGYFVPGANLTFYFSWSDFIKNGRICACLHCLNGDIEQIFYYVEIPVAGFISDGENSDTSSDVSSDCDVESSSGITSDCSSDRSSVVEEEDLAENDDFKIGLISDDDFGLSSINFIGSIDLYRKTIFDHLGDQLFDFFIK